MKAWESISSVGYAIITRGGLCRCVVVCCIGQLYHANGCDGVDCRKAACAPRVRSFSGRCCGRHIGCSSGREPCRYSKFHSRSLWSPSPLQANCKYTFCCYSWHPPLHRTTIIHSLQPYPPAVHTWPGCQWDQMIDTSFCRRPVVSAVCQRSSQLTYRVLVKKQIVNCRDRKFIIPSALEGRLLARLPLLNMG